MKTVFKPLVNNLQTIVKRTYFTGAIELRREVLQNLSKDDKNVKKFFDYYNSSVIKDHQFKNNQDIVSINTTLENAIEDDKKIIEKLPLLANYSYLFRNVCTLVYSENIPIDNKIQQMKTSNPTLYKEYKVAGSKMSDTEIIIQELAQKGFSDSKLILFSLEVLFNGIDKAIEKYPNIITTGSKICYSLPVYPFANTYLSTNSPLQAIIDLIPNSTPLIMQTVNHDSSVPIYVKQLIGLKIMYKHTIINETTYNILDKFVHNIHESIDNPIDYNNYRIDILGHDDV